MKNLFSLLFIAVIALSGFKKDRSISKCAKGFKGTDSLTASEPIHLPESKDKFKIVRTDKGEEQVTRVDGYRILYKNTKGAPFVDMHIEQSIADSFDTDRDKLIESFKYVVKKSGGMETKALMVEDKHGFKVYGMGRDFINAGKNLSTFMIFLDNSTVMYIYFNNLKPEFRNYTTFEDYIKQRNIFLEALTMHLSKCKGR